ncbi:MAG: hypothetical protein AAGD34_14180 [Pseudomonadota bacterium]
MPVILAHGQPKSGSSFLFQVAQHAAELNNRKPTGVLRSELREKLDGDWANYRETVDAAYLRSVLSVLPPHEVAVVKTHAALDPETLPLITARSVIAFTSVRDPRDAALSMVDTGVRDAEANSSREFFKRFVTVDQRETLAAQRHASRILRTYVKKPGILVIPHEATAYAEARVIRRLADHIRLGRHTRQLVATFAKRPKHTILEFNKGQAFRFATELEPSVIQRLNRGLKDEIAFADATIRDAMASLSLLHRYLAIRIRHREVLSL